MPPFLVALEARTQDAFIQELHNKQQVNTVTAHRIVSMPNIRTIDVDDIVLIGMY
jgi:hypothetical protein